MPALTITPHEVGFHCTFSAPWRWAPIMGNPAQAYGEPYPDNVWILEKAIDLYECRRCQWYKQADAIRQWLMDYGMIVELKKDSGVTVKW